MISKTEQRKLKRSSPLSSCLYKDVLVAMAAAVAAAVVVVVLGKAVQAIMIVRLLPRCLSLVVMKKKR